MDAPIAQPKKQRVKWTLALAKEAFAEKGCELLEIEYKNSTTKMQYLCKCGEIAEITMGSFQQGHNQCRQCGWKQSGANISKTQNEKWQDFRDTKGQIVKKEFEKAGLVLLSKYTNNETPLRYICSCGNESTIRYSNFKEGGRCRKCMGERQKQTCMERYGVDNVSKLPETHEKYRQTCIEKYGVDSPFKNPEFLEKRKQTNLEKYGAEYYIQTEEGQAARKQTMLDKYGCDAAHVPEFRSKSMRSSFQTKEWTSPSGRIFKYQGYELLAIQMLLSDGIPEEDILTEEDLCERHSMPEFWYEFESKRCRYFPDLFIISMNKFIEVKSLFTFNTNPEKVMAKGDCVTEAGYDYEIYVFDGKKKFITIVRP